MLQYLLLFVFGLCRAAGGCKYEGHSPRSVALDARLGAQLAGWFGTLLDYINIQTYSGLYSKCHNLEMHVATCNPEASNTLNPPGALFTTLIWQHAL